MESLFWLVVYLTALREVATKVALLSELGFCYQQFIFERAPIIT